MEKFKDLHYQENGLIIGNAWDPLSAMIMQQQGFKAIGTTSWGIANSLGCQDGENIDFLDYFNIIKKILDVVQIPVSIDIESGFGKNNSQVIENIIKLASIGCSGINIEDSNKNGSLKEQETFGLLIKEIRVALDKEKFEYFFINVRTDTYLTLEEPYDETLLRAKLYEKQGADGVFIPGLIQKDEIKSISKNLNIPLNIMTLPKCTDIKELYSNGAKRFSFGNAMSDYIISTIEDACKSILTSSNTSYLYEHNDLEIKLYPNK